MGGTEVEAAKLGAIRVEACSVRDCAISARYSFSSWVTGDQLFSSKLGDSSQLTLLILLLDSLAK